MDEEWKEPMYTPIHSPNIQQERLSAYNHGHCHVGIAKKRKNNFQFISSWVWHMILCTKYSTKKCTYQSKPIIALSLFIIIIIIIHIAIQFHHYNRHRQILWAHQLPTSTWKIGIFWKEFVVNTRYPWVSWPSLPSGFTHTPHHQVRSCG